MSVTRFEPLSEIDTFLLMAYRVFLTVVAAWVCLVGFCLFFPPASDSMLFFVFRFSPLFLASLQGLFFLAAWRRAPFRQRFMTTHSKPPEALKGSLLLFLAAFSYALFAIY